MIIVINNEIINPISADPTKIEIVSIIITIIIQCFAAKPE